MLVDRNENPRLPATFRSVGLSRAQLPFRKRPADNPVYVRFADGVGETQAVEVFVKSDVIRSMREIADRAWPREAIGLLAGRACRDTDGTYSIIDVVEPATADECEATAGSVHLSGAGSAAVRLRLAHQYPALDPIGWYHSHPHSDAFFSSQDLTEQSTWPDAYNVGIVSGDRWGHRTLNIYTGPDADRVTRISPNGSEPAPTPRPTPPARTDLPPANGGERARPTIGRTLLLVAFALTLVVCFAIVVRLLLSSSNQYAQGVSRSSPGRPIASPNGHGHPDLHPGLPR